MAEDVLNVQVGTVLQIEATTPQHSPRRNVMLIGYLPGAGYIVTTPTDNSKIPIVPAGQRFNVRMLRGNTVMGFVTHVLQSDVRPYSRLLLEYSREIERIVVRNAARVSAGIFAAIRNNIESDNELHRVEAGFIVLSSAGAKAGACQSLGEVGGALQFNLCGGSRGSPRDHDLNRRFTQPFHTRGRGGRRASPLSRVQFRGTNRLQQFLLRSWVMERLLAGDERPQ